MKTLTLLSLSLLTTFSFAEVAHITHREALQDFKTFGKAEFEEGKRLYQMVCVACHGDKQNPASVPNARLFHEQPLLNGSDPVAIYRTLTDGFNQMVPQAWMTPEQKYYVIHYMREEFFKKDNPSQFTDLTDEYLASLGDSKIDWPANREQPKAAKGYDLNEVDHGPILFGHFEAAPTNVAPKGLIIGLDGNGVTKDKHHALYDLDTGRLVAFNKGNVLDWNDLNYNGHHREHAKLAGDIAFQSPAGLAWGHLGATTPGHYPNFRDPREPALNGHTYGPLPDGLVKYKGVSLTGPTPVVHYTVSGAEVFDAPSVIMKNGKTIFVRSLYIAPQDKTLFLRTHGKGFPYKFLSGGGSASMLRGGGINEGIIQIKPSDKPTRFHFLTGDRDSIKDLKYGDIPRLDPPQIPTENSASFLTAQAPLDASSVVINYKTISEENGFNLEEADIPQQSSNPWNTRIRFSGIDFLTPDKAVLASWTGDVFLLENIQSKTSGGMRLTRIASGLHQPLGAKIENGQIFIGCRDQIFRPHDFDGDTVADYYEAFNSDHVLTMHFHEFAAGLDTDSKGNFYYVKCSQHADPAVIPTHGTLMKVDADGSSSEVIATGLRSCNGMFVDHDDSVWVTDQEGYWNPQNKIMHVVPGGFHGNMLAWHDPAKISASDDDMVHPMVWLSKAYANSPSEVFRFPDTGWDSLSGTLGYFEYGKGRIMLLPHEEKNGIEQALAHPLPLPDTSTGIMRGRFHPDTQALYACGLFSWGSVRTGVGGLYRLKPTGDSMNCITGFTTKSKTLTLTFTDALEADALSPSSIKLTSYSIKRSSNYGSKLNDETNLSVESLEISSDKKSVTLTIPDLAPTRILSIALDITTPTGTKTITASATIHDLN
ncbi:MAG: DUF6797 domain-containing protein [Luteolibacter sp.]